MAKLLRLLLMVALTLPSLGFAPRPVSAQPAPAAIPIPLDRPLRFERFSLVDGLSQNSALSLLQDSKGYLWIGTQDGLNRYDGYTFTVFKHDPENRDSLSHNSIISLLQAMLDEAEEKQLASGSGAASGANYDLHELSNRYTMESEREVHATALAGGAGTAYEPKPETSGSGDPELGDNVELF